MLGHPRRRTRLAALIAIVALPFLASCSDSAGPNVLPDTPPPGPGPGPGPAPSPGAAGTVVIDPGALLLVAAGETAQLHAIVYDASGTPVQTAVTWQSSDPGTASISSAGVVTAAAGLGSAQITAAAQGMTSAPAVVLIASPASGVVLVPDSLILSDLPDPTDPAAEYGPGWRYRMRFGNAGLSAGQLVVGTGGKPVAGRVVSITDAGGVFDVTLELVPLNQFFAQLSIDEVIPLVEMEGDAGDGRIGAPLRPRPSLNRADTEFTLGSFDCKASGAIPDLDLPNPSIDISPSLSLALGYENGLQKYGVVGSIEADFGYKPVFQAAFEGKVGCERVLRTLTVPLNGFLSYFFGIQVPLGVGFELEGKLEIAEIGFDVSANVTATAELGMLCPTSGGACSGLNTFSTTRDFEFEFIAPDPDDQFKVELGAHAFVFAKPSVGSAFSSATQFEFIDANAGLKQSVNLATTQKQAEDAEYASDFKLAFVAKVGAGSDLQGAIGKLGDLLGVDLSVNLDVVDLDEALEESPKGTFTIDPGNVAPGDASELGEMATFTIELDPVKYLGIESVEKVEIFWKEVDEADSTKFTLVPGRPSCTEIAGGGGKTSFECETDFLEEHLGEQTFYAFVHARLFGVPLPIPLEVAQDGMALVEVGGECTVPQRIEDLRTANFAVRLMPMDSSLTRRKEGPDVQIIRADFDDMSVSVSSETAIGAGATLRWRDYIRIMPEDPARLGEVLFMRFSAVASATVHDDDESQTPGGNDYAADADITDATFLPVEGRRRVTLGIHPGSGHFHPGTEFHVNTIGITDPIRSGQWSRVEGRLSATASRGGEATAEHRFEVLEVVDANGAPVPARVCSALDYEYLPAPPDPAT